jgi:hypothetical protein
LANNKQPLFTGRTVGKLTVTLDDGKTCSCVCECGTKVTRTRDSLLSSLRLAAKPSCKPCMRKRIQSVGAPVRYIRGTTRVYQDPSGEFAAIAVKK